MISVVTALTLTMLFAVGVGYAWWVALHPPTPGLTWLSVVVGCGFTNGAISVLLLEYTHSWVAVMIVWGCYALAGGPMILGQLLKDHKQHRDADQFAENMRRHGRMEDD